MALLEVEQLVTHFRTEDGVARAVDGVSFSLDTGGSLALVGESACGKSVTALSIMRLIRPPGYHPGGAIRFDGQDLLRMPEARLRGIRGNDIAMVFQEPMTSLNPVFTVANQLAEPLVLHRKLTPEQAAARSLALLEQMGIAAPDVVLKSYPHQLSGGMRQRVMIAMAMACEPKLMIADEPTTALDVTVQAQILELLRQLQRERGMALILITHDLGIVNQLCEDVCVMYAGRLAELGTREQILRTPQHPYTEKLLASIPRHTGREQRLTVIPGMVHAATDYTAGCRFAERCDHAAPRCTAQEPPVFHPEQRAVTCFLYDPQDPLPRQAPPAPAVAAAEAPRPAKGETLVSIRDLKTHFPVRRGFFQRITGYVRAVDGVSFDIPQGATLGLVGESGCGKTTLGQSLLRLEGVARGDVRFDGRDVMALEGDDLQAYRREAQIIFQDPFSSLNPRFMVGDIVGEGLLVHEPQLTAAERAARVGAALAEVGLERSALTRYIHEFSGGQRQRIALARALVLRPRFIVLDEATSALDVSVQAQILNLLRDLQLRHGLTYLFITHDLGVVQYLCDAVAVMYLGRVVEYGPTARVFAAPAHPYTRSLLTAVPDVHERKPPPPLVGDVPSPLHPPAGCHFHPRCPVRQATQDARLAAACDARFPGAHDVAPGQVVHCWAAQPAEALPELTGTERAAGQAEGGGRVRAQPPA